MRPGKLYALQVVRALAAILVVWVHANDVTKTLGIPVFGRSLDALQRFGACGVDLFFVLSGFVVSLSAARPQNPGGFLGRRFLRIYPLCWIVLIIFTLVNLGMFSPGFPLSRTEVAGRLAYSALLLPSPTPSQAMGAPWLPNSWTLVHEVFFYACLFLGLRSRRWDARLFAVVAVVGMVALNVVLYGVLGKPVPFVVYYGSPIALEFVFGVGLGWVLPRLRPEGGWRYAIVGLGVLGFLVTLFASPLRDAPVREDILNTAIRVVVWGIPATLVVGGLSLFDWKPRTKLGAAAVYAGDACYSIYLFQWLPLEAAARALPALSRVVGGDVAILLAVAFVTLCGIAFYTLVERPLMHRLNARFFPKTPRGVDAGIAPPELEATLKPNV